MNTLALTSGSPGLVWLTSFAILLIGPIIIVDWRHDLFRRLSRFRVKSLSSIRFERMSYATLGDTPTHRSWYRYTLFYGFDTNSLYLRRSRLIPFFPAFWPTPRNDVRPVVDDLPPLCQPAAQRGLRPCLPHGRTVPSVAREAICSLICELMKLLFRLTLGFLTLATVGAAEPGPVFIAPLKSEVSPAQFYFVRRALKEAERAGASAFVLEMETPGGQVAAASDEMDALLKTKVPTYTYVNARALSAGALIAMATQKIYMAPNGVIGAAAPVDSSGEDLSKTMKQKSVSAISAMARAAAQKNKHNSDVADAFIDDSKEVKVGETVVHKGGSLLTLSAEEATRAYDGKPLLAAGIANSLEEMLAMATLTGRVVHLEPTGFERLAFWITSLAPIFLLGGIIGAYIEFKVPGFGLPGLVAIICFALFFLGHYVAGLAGWEVIVCFAVGLALVLGELILHPGTILPGLVGALLMLGALVYAMIDRWPSDPVWPTGDQLLEPMLQLTVTFLLSIAAIVLLARLLPRTSLYGNLVLQAAVPSGSLTPARAASADCTLGEIGEAHTDLRPSGKALFGGEPVAVVTSGAFIERGARVRIITVEGARVVVEAVG